MRKYIQHKHFWNILKIFSSESMYNKNLELLSSNICPLCEKVSTITLPLPGLTRHNITIYGADKLGISIWNFYQNLSPDQNFCKLGGDIAGVLQGFDFDGVIWDEIWDRLLYSDCREPSHCDRGHSLGIHLTAAHTRDFWARGLARHLVATRCHYQQLVFGIPIACHLLFISAALSDIPSHTFADVKMWMQTLWREMFTRSTCQILTRELSLLDQGQRWGSSG